MIDPRVLVAGQCFGYPAKGYRSGHGVEARDVGLARGLHRLGWQVDLISTDAGMTDDETYNRIDWKDIIVEDYDAILSVEITGWRRIAKHPEIAAKVEKHLNVSAVLDSLYDDIPAFLRSAGQTSPQLVARQRLRFPKQDVFLLPWATADIPEGLPSPWAEPKTGIRVINTGIIWQRYLDAMNELADDPKIEMWLGGPFRFCGAPAWGLTKADRDKKCNPKLHLMSDLAPFYGRPITDDKPEHGPVRYGDHFPFLIHADVGLNWVQGQGWSPISCKIADYMGAGLATVSEAGVPNNGDIITLNCGCVVPQGDTPAMHKAIFEQAAIKRDREAIRRAARALGTWNDSAELIDLHLKRGWGGK